MKESIIDVLMFLFEHYVDDEQIDAANREALQDELVAAGFGNTQVRRAFDWLEELAGAEAPQAIVSRGDTMRIYTRDEQARLGSEGIGFLHFLEQQRVLTPTTREQVIERACALDGHDIDLDDLKWVVLMVVFNQPDDDGDRDLAWVEELVYDERPFVLH